ncbi:MAG: sensor domain-containing diguanylate cyclase [Gammaproteobacteria bacterium]|nr:sensor domain-containing diguanylate cyclase [Gammaproteobacteria bacterium]
MEADRLAALRSLGLLDTEPEERFDRYTRIAQRVFGVPIALISLVDEDRVWYKSNRGFELNETPRDIAFCNYAILNDDIMVVEDVNTDDRFQNSPLVDNESGIRFYAGCPIKTSKGACIGTLCILDYKPRKLGAADLQLLRDLGTMVEGEFTVQNIATVDDLTGLSNRRGFQAIARHAIAMCQRLQNAATLMFFDLDGFKNVNDTYGHAEGDKVLIDIGQILLQEFRNSDVIARLGGDEFCVFLTGTNADHIDRPLENLNNAISARNKLHEYSVGYSVGTVAYIPDQHASIEDLLAEADQLMYDNKRKKKTR